MGNIIYSILWLVILLFIGFWVAGIAAGLYILIIPFTVCINGLSIVSITTALLLIQMVFFAFQLYGLTDFLLTVIQFPKLCSQRMVDGRGFD